MTRRDHVLTHKLENLGQILQRDSLERRIDQTSSKEVNRLLCILAVPNVATLDVDHFDDRLEHWSLEECMCRKANCDDRTTGSSIFHGLLEGLLGDGQQKHCMRTKTVGRGGLDVGDKVLGLGEVDVGLVILSVSSKSSLFF